MIASKKPSFGVYLLLLLALHFSAVEAFSNVWHARSRTNKIFSWDLKATRKASAASANTKVLYQKVVRPSGNLPDILFLGYLVEYLESHYKLPDNLPMVYETLPSSEENRSILSFDSPLSPSSDATRMDIEVVGIYTDGKDKQKQKSSVPNMAMVVVKKMKAHDGASIPPMMENLFADSEKRILKSLDRGLEEFISGKIKFKDEKGDKKAMPNVKTAEQAIEAEIVDEIPVPKASKQDAKDVVFETIATPSDVETETPATTELAKEAAMDTIKVKANPKKPSPDASTFSSDGQEDFAVQAARKAAKSKKGVANKKQAPEEDFAVAAARKAAASKKGFRKKSATKKKRVKEGQRQESSDIASRVSMPSTPEQSFKGSDYMGNARTFRTTISRPTDIKKKTNAKKKDQVKTRKMKTEERIDIKKIAEDIKSGNEIAAAKEKKSAPTPSKEQIEQDIMKAAAEVMDELSDKSEDMTPEQLLQDILKFDEEENKSKVEGGGFVGGAFEKAKELMQDRYRQRQQKMTQTVSGVKPDIVDPNAFPVEQKEENSAEEELKRMFEAGERLADGRIVQSMKDGIELGFSEETTEADIDELIANDKTISNYARVLDDELVELELQINPTPGEELDGPMKNPVFDIMSGPEVYNPNVEMDTVNYPGALPGTKELRLPKKLEEAKKQAEFAAGVLETIKTVESKDELGETKAQYFAGEKEISQKQLKDLQTVVTEAVEIGIIPDPLTLMQERSTLQLVVDELKDQPNERFQDIASNYKELFLSDNFVRLVKERMTQMADRDLDALRRDDESLKEPHAREREILVQLVGYAQLLLKEARALGAELEAQQLEVVRSICKVAMNPAHTTEEETAMALTDAVRDMRPMLDDVFVAYLKYAVAEEEARLARAGLLDDPEHNQWLFVLQIVQQGVHAEIARGISRHIDHIGYVLRMKTPRQRRMLLDKLIDDMPTMDVRPFVQVVDNIVGSLGDGVRGEFDGFDTLGELTNEILQLHRDVKELLPPERIALKARDADEWAEKQRKRLMEARKVTKQRLRAANDTAHLQEEVESLGRRGEIERIE